MSGRTTACAWLTAWAIESSHSDHVGRTSNVPDRVVAPGSIGKGVGDATRFIAVDHRAPRLTPWPAPGIDKEPRPIAIRHRGRRSAWDLGTREGLATMQGDATLAMLANHNLHVNGKVLV